MMAAAVVSSLRLLRHGRVVAEAIRLEQSLFALPFTIAGLLLGAWGLPEARVVFWAVVAFSGARTLGMAANRLIDRHIDARNPAARSRALPAGLMSAWEMGLIAVGGAGLLVLGAAQLNPLCLALSPLAAAIVTLYPYMKRFTWLCHAGVGLSLGSGPIGGWLAATGAFEAGTWLLGFAVLFWATGFDILWHIGDVAFDREQGLYSLPASFGVSVAFMVAKVCHLATLACIAAVGLVTQMGPLFWVGLLAATALLVQEHRLVRPDGPGPGRSFFLVNSSVSFVALLGVVGGLYGS